MRNIPIIFSLIEKIRGFCFVGQNPSRLAKGSLVEHWLLLEIRVGSAGEVQEHWRALNAHLNVMLGISVPSRN